MGPFRILVFLCLSAISGCQCRDSAYVSAKPSAADAAVKQEDGAGSNPFGRLVAASVTVSYPIPDGEGGAHLMNYSGIALDATHVLTVVVHDLPAEAKAPTIWFEDQDKSGTSWNFETVPGKEILLTEVGLKVLTSERPLQGTAMLAPKSDAPLGATVWVIGTYMEGLDGMIMRGSVAKLGGPPNDEDTFLIDAALSSSSAGAGVYDDRHALVGVVAAPFIAKELGIISTRVGAVLKIEKVAEALRKRGVAFSLETAP